MKIHDFSVGFFVLFFSRSEEKCGGRKRTKHGGAKAYIFFAADKRALGVGVPFFSVKNSCGERG